MLQLLKDIEAPAVPRVTRTFESQFSFHDALTVYGLTRADMELDELIVRRGQTVVLRERLTGHPLETSSVAQFKEWIGLSDAIIERHPLEGLPELPRAEWTRGRVIDPTALTDDEWEDVQRATNAYLFGHSGLVAGYREVIELLYGPFAADVFALPRIVVECGGTLVVNGRPAAILAEDFELHEGGDVRLYTVTSMSVESLQKLSIVA